MNSKLAYLVGLIGGDGCICTSQGDYSIHVVDDCLEFHRDTIAPLFEQCFGMRARISQMKTHLKRTTFRTRLRSKKIAESLISLGIPSGEKTYTMKSPNWILRGSREIQRSYVRGWMDAEGCVTRLLLKREKKNYIYPKISMQVANASIRDELCAMLERFGVRFSKWDSGHMHGFAITGFKNTGEYMNAVGFTHPRKLTAWGKTWHTMAETMGCDPERGSESHKLGPSSDWGL